MSLYPKQRDALRALAQPASSVTFWSCNEGGKTKRVITAAILWHLEACRGPVISTSGSFRQIKDQLNPALRQFAGRFPGWQFLDCRIQTPWTGVFWDGFSTREAGRFEGHHSDKGIPLLIIFDEAKSIPRAIYEARDRCKPRRFLQASSSGFCDGGFYDSWHGQRAMHTCVHQTWDEVPNWTQEEKDRLCAKYPGGLQNPFVASVAGFAFIPMVEDAIILISDVNACIEQPPDHRGRERKAFCDFAAGRDENVLAVRTGNRIELEDCWRDANTMSAVGRFISHFVRLGLHPEEIEGDADGLGKPMCDAMADAGWPIVQFHGGQSARWDEHYDSLWAEAWYGLVEAIKQRKVILPDDEELKAQLVSRKKRYSRRGKLALESKEDMRKLRQLPSPDRADAVAGAFSALVQRSTIVLGAEQRGWLEEIADHMDDGKRGGWDSGG